MSLSQAPSVTPSVSGNGQFVVFASAPGTEDGRTSSIWLDDRATNTLSELTKAKDGVRLGNSVNPVISVDGCVVVITTEMAYDLFRDDDKGQRWDVYRATLPACGGKVGDWAVVSTRPIAGGQAQARGDVDPTQPAAVSSSGSVVTYVRRFQSLSGSEKPALRPFAADLVDVTIPLDQPGHTTPVPGLPTEVADNGVTYGGQSAAVLSGDGNVVVFTSDATSTDAVPRWIAPVGAATTVPNQVYAWNRADPDPFTAVTLVSAGSGGAADASAVGPSVSSDGRFVAFSSSATNLGASAALAACGTVCPAQIYLADRDSDNNQILGEPGTTTVRLVSAVAGAPGAPDGAVVVGNGASFAPTLSADGKTVAFATHASNLMPVRTPGGGEAGDGDLLIASSGANGLHRVFDSPSPAPGAHAHPHLSGNGRVFVADSLAVDRLVGDPTITGRHVVAASFVPTLSLADSDLGTVTVGIPGPEWFVRVVNDGPGAFLPAAVTLDNPADFAVTGGTCLDRAAVSAGQNCTVNLILTPSVPGPLSTTLTVAEAGFGAITLTASVKGAGGEPALFAEPRGADLGSVVVGQLSPVPARFDITNIYLGPTVVTSATIGGANPKDFAISSTGCGADVAMGGSCPVEVTFKPTSAGRRTATVRVSTSAGQYTSMFVSGEGHYTPVLLSNDGITPGQNLGIGGTGFPAKVAVVLGWSDGRGRSMTVITDDNGSFLTNLTVVKAQRPGEATLIAQVVGGPSATKQVAIAKLAKKGTDSATWSGP